MHPVGLSAVHVNARHRAKAQIAGRNRDLVTGLKQLFD
jgi:hypothetical protein